MNNLQKAQRLTENAAAEYQRQKAALALQIQRDIEKKKAIMAAEDAFRSYGPVSSGEVVGREQEAFSAAKYQTAPVMPQNAAFTLKSDIAAPLRMDPAGRLGTASYQFTGRKYGPVAEKRAVISTPNIVQKIFNWVKGVVSSSPVKTDMASAHMRKMRVVSPMKNIQSRLMQQGRFIEQAKSRSYIHKWGDWAITYKKHRPNIPPKQITAGEPGLAPSMGSYRTVARQR